VTQVRNEVLEPALKAVIAELERMEKSGPAEELSNARISQAAPSCSAWKPKTRWPTSSG
jgi:hypothetical protein